jgi:hypothetical protein
MKIDTDQSILSNIHPRLCILHKWSHFDGKKKDFHFHK